MADELAQNLLAKYRSGYTAAADPLRRGTFDLMQLLRAAFGADPNQEGYRHAGFNSGMLERSNRGAEPFVPPVPWEGSQGGSTPATPGAAPAAAPTIDSLLPPQPPAGAATGEMPTEQAWREAERAARVQEAINRLYGMQRR